MLVSPASGRYQDRSHTGGGENLPRRCTPARRHRPPPKAPAIGRPAPPAAPGKAGGGAPLPPPADKTRTSQPLSGRRALPSAASGPSDQTESDPANSPRG